MNFIESIKRGGADRLPPLPHAALQIMNAMRADEVDTARLAEVISTDPTLAARVLGMANSAFYSTVIRVDTVQRAVAVMGTEAIKNMALLIIVSKNFNAERLRGFDYDGFWMRAITSAVACDTLSTRLGSLSEDAFAAGLLMDIGSLVMYYCEPERYRGVIERASATKTHITEIEHAAFGTDHQRVGREVLTMWGLPMNIAAPVGAHHIIRGCPPEYLDTAKCLKFASVISLMDLDNLPLPMLVKIKTFLDNIHELSFDEVESLVRDIREKRDRIFASMGFTPMPPAADAPEGNVDEETQRWRMGTTTGGGAPPIRHAAANSADAYGLLARIALWLGRIMRGG